jgi:tetratricopeptide (TPR) repeat protein
VSARGWLVAALVAVVAAAPARAQPDDKTARAKALFDEANKHYDLREFPEAIDLFRKAYDLMPDPEFLFDIAQAYRQLHDCRNADEFYRTFLRNRPDADNRAKVEKFIVDMDACAKQQDAEREAERQRKEAQAAVVQPLPPRRRRDHRTLRLAGLGTIGGGLLLTGIAVYFSADAASQSNAIVQACKLGCEATDVAGFDRTGHDDNRNAAILFGVGGAALAAGAGMLLWATFHVDYETITVTPAPGGATVGARLRF